VTASGSHLVDRALGELEERLDPRQFVRIHRGAIVNLAWVGEVRPDLGGRLVVRLKDAGQTCLRWRAAGLGASRNAWCSSEGSGTRVWRRPVLPDTDCMRSASH